MITTIVKYISKYDTSNFEENKFNPILTYPSK